MSCACVYILDYARSWTPTRAAPTWSCARPQCPAHRAGECIVCVRVCLCLLWWGVRRTWNLTPSFPQDLTVKRVDRGAILADLQGSAKLRHAETTHDASLPHIEGKCCFVCGESMNESEWEGMKTLSVSICKWWLCVKWVPYFLHVCECVLVSLLTYTHYLLPHQLEHKYPTTTLKSTERFCYSR